jgi:arabinofuranosyltransferase
MEETLRSAGATLGNWDRRRSAVLVLSAVVFTYVFLVNTWVCDDAYITFRASDNLIHGLGLRWNVAERVQVFTNPLWLLVMAGAAWLTGEFFYTALFISLGFCLAAVGVAMVSLKSPAKAWLLLALLLSSKAFVDYSSSGLEYPLSYLLLAVFVVLSRAQGVPERGRAGDPFVALIAVASLGFVNRADTALLYAPTLAWLGLARARRLDWRTAGRVLVASAPAWGWLAFALVYFGFLFPNPYYAKVATGIPHWLQVKQE